jgi:hypothetical protein
MTITEATTAAAAPAVVPAEAGWDTAPSLVDGAMDLRLGPATCDLRYWFGAVPQGTLRGHVRGHADDVLTPPFMRRPGR